MMIGCKDVKLGPQLRRSDTRVIATTRSSSREDSDTPRGGGKVSDAKKATRIWPFSSRLPTTESMKVYLEIFMDENGSYRRMFRRVDHRLL